MNGHHDCIGEWGLCLWNVFVAFVLYKMTSSLSVIVSVCLVIVFVVIIINAACCICMVLFFCIITRF